MALLWCRALFLPIKLTAALHHLLGLSILALLPWLPVQWGDNEAAGALLLFLPVWLAHACTPERSPRRLGFALLSMISFGALLALGSRGALIAALLAIPVVFMLGSAISRRCMIGLALQLGFGAVVIMVSAPGALGRIVDGFLLEDRLQGLTIHGVLSGRPSIWWHGATAAWDLPLGIGVGTFSTVIEQAYPTGTSAPAHAHQWMLQSGLELGWPGLLALMALWVTCGRVLVLSLCRSEPGSFERWANAGLAGSVTGFWIFGLADCLPPGNPSSLGTWSLLALLAHRPTAGRPARLLPRRVRRGCRWHPCSCLCSFSPRIGDIARRSVRCSPTPLGLISWPIWKLSRRPRAGFG